YFSPYPDAFGLQPLLYICEFSLKYIKKHRVYERHLRDNTKFCPPGVEIYRCVCVCVYTSLSQLHLWQVYCQCLCLLAKLFLDHKTLYFDTDPFLFYVRAFYSFLRSIYFCL
ncbi:acyl-CoA N-acyltransferase, partial [Pavlovales sp. CCMP2436]